MDKQVHKEVDNQLHIEIHRRVGFFKAKQPNIETHLKAQLIIIKYSL